MLYKKICGIAAGLFLVFSVASTQSQAAEGDKYFGVGYSAVDYTLGFPLATYDYSLGALYGKFGTWFTDNVAGEVRLGLGISDDKDKDGDTLSLDNFVGGYIRAGASSDSAFAPYFIAGYTRAKASLEYSNGSEESDSDTDISFGVGVDIATSGDSSINVEWMNYYDEKEDGVSNEFTAIGLMWVKKF